MSKHMTWRERVLCRILLFVGKIVGDYAWKDEIEKLSELIAAGVPAGEE